MISSFAQAFVTTLSPPSHEIGWNTIGNMALCRTQGALYTIGAVSSPLYNCSLCTYYLIEIKFTQYIPSINRIERYFHTIPIVISLTTCIYLLATDAIHPIWTHCWAAASPLGCENDETTDCERGLEYKKSPVLFIILILFLIVIPVIIIGSMVMIYREVAAQEARMSQFSFTVRRSSRAVRNRVAARNRAIAYSAAYLLTALWFFVMTIIILVSATTSVPRWISVLHYTFMPLQGFFNLIVFLQPRVSRFWPIHKRSHGNNVMKVFYLTMKDSILSRGQQNGRERSATNTIRAPSTRMVRRPEGGTTAENNRSNRNEEEEASRSEAGEQDKRQDCLNSPQASNVGTHGGGSTFPLKVIPSHGHDASSKLTDGQRRSSEDEDGHVEEESLVKNHEAMVLASVDDEEGCSSKLG